MPRSWDYTLWPSRQPPQLEGPGWDMLEDVLARVLMVWLACLGIRKRKYKNTELLAVGWVSTYLSWHGLTASCVTIVASI